MNIGNVTSNTQTAATADTTTVEHSRQTTSEQLRTDSATGRQQSVLRDPGERMLAGDVWRGTPGTERSLSNGPQVPTLASTDLLQAVDHAVKFVMGELG